MNVRDEFAPIAKELLTEIGAVAILTRSTASANGLTKRSKLGLDTELASSTTTINTMAVKLKDAENVVNGVNTTQVMVMLLDEPVEGDKLVFAGRTYLIGKVTATEPQGQGIVWKAALS